jgi:hypothetical protein
VYLSDTNSAPIIYNNGTGLSGNLGAGEIEGTVRTIHVPGAPIARWVTLWSFGAGCSVWTTVHAFTEFEVWGYEVPSRADIAPAPVQGPSC